MTDEAIEAACSAYIEHERYGLEEAMSAAIAAYEQAMWRKEEIADGALLHLIDGVVWYRPLPPLPGKEG